MTYSFLTVDHREKGVSWVTINHPPVNAVGNELMEELTRVANELKENDAVRVVVLTSAHPKIFLAGADLKGMMQPDEASLENPIEAAATEMQTCFNQFSEMPKPVIAAINGHALGGGCELALACDFRLMSKGTIGLTEVSLGIIPGAGGTQRMTEILGRAKALENIFLAKKLTPAQAEAEDLITKAVADLEEETTEFAEKLALGAVFAMGQAKVAINASELPLEKGLKVEAKAFSKTFESEEPGIGLAAFFQKETPKFYSGE